MLTVQEMDSAGAVIAPDVSRLDAASSIKLREEVFPMVDKSLSRLILDLKSVDFVDSSGLGVMVGLLKKIGTQGDLIICNLQPSVAATFKLSRMDRVFRICPDVDAAKAMLERTA